MPTPPLQLTCFKAYDVRGQLGTQLTNDIAYRIGRAFATHLHAKTVVVGGDIRQTSPALKAALAQGLMDSGTHVIDLGMVGTEEVYFAAMSLDVCGGIEVTASHNPIDYNGMKFVKRGAQPISGDTGLKAIQALAQSHSFATPAQQGTLTHHDILPAYCEHLLTYITPANIKPLKLVVNAGNGAAGHVIDALEPIFAARGVPIEFIKINHAPDGTFPNGIPNPLLPENRSATSQAVIQHQADMGIAWDGDFDRCFFFDGQGQFIEGYYIVGLLAAAYLAKTPHGKIIYDPRLIWNTLDLVQQYGGTAIQSKSGHSFIKEKMRQEDAVYGGEMSAHHYFKSFAYCDSGMIPWLLVAELLSTSGKTLSQWVSDRITAYPCSGEINFTVSDAPAVLQRIETHFAPQTPHIDRTDGLSLQFQDWRVNIRSSNTEPLLRLNIETRANPALLKQSLTLLSTLISANLSANASA